MSFRPTKKRALEDNVPTMPRLSSSLSTTPTATTITTRTPEAGSSSTTSLIVAKPPSAGGSGSVRSSFPVYCLQHQVESLQAELDHERSLRLLDQKRADQARQRLEKQLALATEEAQQATQQLQDFTDESNKVTTQLRTAHNTAISELRTCQMQLLTQQQDEDDQKDDSEMLQFWEEKCNYLEEELANHQESEEKMRREMEDIRKDIQAKIEAQRLDNEKTVKSLASSPFSPQRLMMEEAPSALITELNHVRLELANSKRHERLAKRRIDDLEDRNKTLLQEREQALLASQRLPVVAQQLTQLRTEHEAVAAENAAWKQFEQSLATTLQTTTMQQSPSASSSSSSRRKSKSSGPPEVSTIERYLREAKTRAANMEVKKKELQDECQQLRASILPLQKQLQELQQEQREWSRERRAMEQRVEIAARNLQQAEAQQAIYQREAEELRSLIKTCDNLPLGGSTSTNPLSSPKMENSIKTLELTLSTKQQELDLARQQVDRLSKEKQVVTTELETVKEKFGKLRDALFQEREKAQQAEQRANAAEALAGKGSFDPETTRVLHMNETPLAQTLREEVQVLQRQLEVMAKNNNKNAAAAAATGKSPLSAAAGAATTKMSVDAEKLNKRLKENFKEQIALFREGVYLMTGFKVDMLPGADRPTFRVRSVYAEKEEDHLLLKWPKKSASSSGSSSDVKTLDVLNTDFAKQLTTTSSYEYMTKFASLPAFLAAVQLNLFEKQTVMIA